MVIKKYSLKKLMFLALGWLAIICVLKSSLIETNWERCNKILEEKRQKYTDNITKEEIDMLFRKWPLFKQEEFSKDLIVSYRAANLANDMSFYMKMWSVYHVLDLDRLLYVQQRVVDLFNYLEIRESAQAVINRLSSRRNDPLVAEMIKVQKARLDMGSFGDAEVRLVKSKEEELKQLFKQYP